MATAASILISLEAARLTVASCISSFSSVVVVAILQQKDKPAVTAISARVLNVEASPTMCPLCVAVFNWTLAKVSQEKSGTATEKLSVLFQLPCKVPIIWIEWPTSQTLKSLFFRDFFFTRGILHSDFCAPSFCSTSPSSFLYKLSLSEHKPTSWDQTRMMWFSIRSGELMPIAANGFENIWTAVNLQTLRQLSSVSNVACHHLAVTFWSQNTKNMSKINHGAGRRTAFPPTFFSHFFSFSQ